MLSKISKDNTKTPGVFPVAFSLKHRGKTSKLVFLPILMFSLSGIVHFLPTQDIEEGGSVFQAKVHKKYTRGFCVVL